MRIAMIGLGRMGSNMVRRLLRGGHECVVYDRDISKVRELEQVGARGARSLEELPELLEQPAVAWMMLPAGEVTESAVRELSGILRPGDILVDGGNSFFKDDVRRARALRERGIFYLDVGVSGGVWGLERGYCLMYGGEQQAAAQLEPVFKTLAPGSQGVPWTEGRHIGVGRTADEGYLYCGPSGSGHFVKMIHNGIEYGMMQALAEGFDLLQGASKPVVAEEYRYNLDLAEIAEVWRRGSVVSSWLLDLVALALNEDSHLSRFVGRVADSGEGRWTVQTAIEQQTPAEVLSSALFVRFRSREAASYAEKLLSAMRSQFGGHKEAA